jgi:hypothetical protein
VIGLAAAAAYTASNLPDNNTLATMRAQIRRAVAARGWPAAAAAQAAELADTADDGEELGELAAWLGVQPYPGARAIANIASAAAGAGRYTETLGSVARVGAEGALDDAAALAGASRSLAGAASTGAGALARSPGLAVALLAAAAGLVYALRR